MGLLSKISKNRGTSASESPPVAAESSRDPTLRGAAAVTASRSSSALPPPIPCLLCDCPGVWISIYDVDGGPDDPSPEFRCPDCQPPPAWSMVAGLWLLTGADPSSHRWELSPRFARDSAKATALADAAGPGDEAAAADPSGKPINRLAELDSLPLPLATLTGRDGSIFTFYGRYSHSPGTGWSDLIRLWLRSDEQRAWSMLQRRTDEFFKNLER